MLKILNITTTKLPWFINQYYTEKKKWYDWASIDQVRGWVHQQIQTKFKLIVSILNPFFTGRNV
jgi:hypothetical protein